MPARGGEFTSVDDYGRMASDLLGDGAVTSEALVSLADLVRRVRRARAEERGFRRVSRAALVQQVWERDWMSGSVPPARVAGSAGGSVDVARGKVPGLHYVNDMSNLDGLAEWLVRILPGVDRGVDRAELFLKLRVGFGKQLDEGVSFEVGGYRVELRPDVDGDPRMSAAVPPKGKLEQRINSFIELADQSGEASTRYLDGGLVVRAGNDVVVGRGYLSGGRGKVSSRIDTVAESVGSMMYLKPDDEVGELVVPVRWSARVSVVGAGSVA